eukprot:SM000015S01269  [mRNA]  locus=s15:974582:979723:+ [translate_table: standard]
MSSSAVSTRHAQNTHLLQTVDLLIISWFDFTVHQTHRANESYPGVAAKSDQQGRQSSHRHVAEGRWFGGAASSSEMGGQKLKTSDLHDLRNALCGIFKSAKSKTSVSKLPELSPRASTTAASPDSAMDETTAVFTKKACQGIKQRFGREAVDEHVLGRQHGQRDLPVLILKALLEDVYHIYLHGIPCMDQDSDRHAMTKVQSISEVLESSANRRTAATRINSGRMRNTDLKRKT